MDYLDWLLTAARFVSIAASILLVAAYGFYLFICRSDFRSTKSAHFPERLIWLSAVAAFLGQIAWLGGLFWSLSQEVGSAGFEQYQTFFFGTQVGKIGLVRCCLLLLLMAYRLLRFSRGRTKILVWTEPVLAFVQLALLSWLSHAAAVVGPWGWIQTGTDLLHLTSTAIWPAGLIPVWLLLRQTAPESTKRDSLVRFSNISLLVAPLVGATGILSAYFRLHAVAPLITTPYGRYVLLKAACFFVLIGLGAANRLRLMPAFRGTSSEVPLLTGNWQRLQRNILIEQLLLVVVLLAVARLGQLPPPEP